MTTSQTLNFTHRWVPAPNAEAAPTLLLLHGTGGNENDLLELGRMLAPNANLLSPRGNVLENGMPRFFRRLAEGVFDLEDLRARTEELAQFVMEAARAYGFDARKVIAVGFSNGANIAGSLLLRRPGLLSRAVLLRPMVPFVPETLPALANTPIFVSAGQADPIVSVAETERLVSLLQAAGANVTLRWNPGGHNLTNAELIAAQAWLAERK